MWGSQQQRIGASSLLYWLLCFSDGMLCLAKGTPIFPSINLFLLILKFFFPSALEAHDMVIGIFPQGCNHELWPKFYTGTRQNVNFKTGIILKTV